MLQEPKVTRVLSVSEDGTYRAVIDGVERFVGPGSLHLGAIIKWLEAGNTTEPEAQPTPTAADLERVRNQKLAAGFDYDFGDVRGVHRIGTTEADMVGWDEVSKGAQAAINTGQPDTPFTILTDTGPVDVTAMEWQRILAGATAFRQPIWLVSFAIAADMPATLAELQADPRWPSAPGG